MFGLNKQERSNLRNFTLKCHRLPRAKEKGDWKWIKRTNMTVHFISLSVFIYFAMPNFVLSTLFSVFFLHNIRTMLKHTNAYIHADLRM